MKLDLDTKVLLAITKKQGISDAINLCAKFYTDYNFKYSNKYPYQAMRIYLDYKKIDSDEKYYSSKHLKDFVNSRSDTMNRYFSLYYPELREMLK